jgi:hypothetical protein
LAKDPKKIDTGTILFGHRKFILLHRIKSFA